MSDIIISGIVCLGHKIACKKQDNTLVTMNADYVVPRDLHIFSLSWKILANHLTRDQNIVIHGNACIILYINDEFTTEVAQMYNRTNWMSSLNSPISQRFFP